MCDCGSETETTDHFFLSYPFYAENRQKLLNTEDTIMDIIFWDFLILYQFFFHHKYNKTWLLLINMVKRVASQVGDQLKT